MSSCIVRGLGLAALFWAAGFPSMHAREAVVTEPGGTRLTWEECVRLALRNNPDLESSRQSVLNAEAVKKGSSSGFYPQISAALSGTRTFSADLSAQAGQGETEASTAAETSSGLAATTSYASEYESQLTLQQMLFDGFKTKGNVDQARAELKLAFADLGAQKAMVSYELKAGFAQLLYAQELLVISRDVVKIRQDNARMLKLLYEGGREDKGAWLLSEANLKTARFEYDQALRNRDVSERQLLTVIGKDLPGPVQALGNLELSVLPAQPDFKKLAVLTPAYFQQQARTDAAAAGITIAQSSWYPSVTASASAYRTGSGIMPRDKEGWSAGVAVSYPIFEGGQTYFNVKAARASLLQQLAALRGTANETELALAQDFKELADAVDNVRIQRGLLEARELRYRIEEAKYRNGLTSFQDFNTITDSYVEQQKSYLAARREVVLTEANWEQSKGTGALP